MKKIFAFVLATLLSGCVTGPEIEAGKGNIFGKVTARSHKEFLAKYQVAGKAVGYERIDGKEIRFSDEMVNYETLDEVYVGLIAPHLNQQVEHALTITGAGASRQSALVAMGDTIKVENNTSGSLTFYLINPTTDDVQEYPPVPAGQSAVMSVDMEGFLELGADEEDGLTVNILSVKNLVSQQLRSGQVYAFTGLNPGTYDVLFWFWRLGKLEHRVEVQAGVNFQLNETLAIDRTVH